ncbi:MAG: hypothetical protein HY260_02250, partial [Chloroflexi bacterium]|nr:hypothetical protein [Chloroflexota bacterium]
MDGTRRTLALMMTMTIVAGFAFLFVQTATPAAKAEENGGTHLGWLGGCFPPVMAVGRYYPGDAPCHPRETVSLAELQQEFNAQGLIKNGEHLEYAPQPRARALTC